MAGRDHRIASALATVGRPRLRHERRRNVVAAPSGDILPASRRLFDNLVGLSGLQRWEVNGDRFGCLEINHELELGDLSNRNVSWFGALEDLINREVKSGRGRSDNHLIDLNHAVIMDVEATTCVRQAEVAAAKTMIERTATFAIDHAEDGNGGADGVAGLLQAGWARHRGRRTRLEDAVCPGRFEPCARTLAKTESSVLGGGLANQTCNSMTVRSHIRAADFVYSTTQSSGGTCSPLT